MTPKELTVVAEMAGTVTAVLVPAGAPARQGQALIAIEAMKLEQLLRSPEDTQVAAVLVAVGDVVAVNQPLVRLRPAILATTLGDEVAKTGIRPELEELRERKSLLADSARPKSVARRHAAGRRTAREVLSALVDEGFWVEYGGLAVAAQRTVRTPDELRAETPGDGFLGGLGRIDGVACAVMTYDYMVLAGTQGFVGHRKKDRLFEVIERLRVPAVLFTEGGGGRPSDTDVPFASALDADAFRLWAKLSGKVPRIGVVAGRCFAGNAGLLGLCDVVIATRGSSIGMGGPAMIAGGGLGTVAADDVGPAEMHYATGVVDLLVEDDDEAVEIVRRLVDLLAGPPGSGEQANQAPLRDAIPANRRQSYDVHSILDVLFDTGTVLELRGGFGPSIVTAFARLGGRTVGIIASDCRHLAGALDSEACDKASRFLQWCESLGLPVITLIDTPGIMVGVEAEKTALVRHSARLFTVAAQLTVPLVAVILRRAVGLGGQALLGGSLQAPLLTVAWPTGELSPMGLEGAVRLALAGQLRELPPDEADQLVVDNLAVLEERATAVNVASYGEIDDVIDPADTRRSLLAVLEAAAYRKEIGRTWIDTW
jgi:acetyl-CoA carboxylase carboxyltransferase component